MVLFVALKYAQNFYINWVSILKDFEKSKIVFLLTLMKLQNYAKHPMTLIKSWRMADFVRSFIEYKGC